MKDYWRGFVAAIKEDWDLDCTIGLLIVSALILLFGTALIAMVINAVPWYAYSLFTAFLFFLLAAILAGFNSESGGVGL